MVAARSASFGVTTTRGPRLSDLAPLGNNDRFNAFARQRIIRGRRRPLVLEIKDALNRRRLCVNPHIRQIILTQHSSFNRPSQPLQSSTPSRQLALESLLRHLR